MEEEEGKKERNIQNKLYSIELLSYYFADTETISRGINHNTRANLR